MPLDQNPQALVFATIAKVRIHERRLAHVAKHTGSIEPNVQQERECQPVYHYNKRYYLNTPHHLIYKINLEAHVDQNESNVHLAHMIIGFREINFKLNSF